MYTFRGLLNLTNNFIVAPLIIGSPFAEKRVSSNQNQPPTKVPETISKNGSLTKTPVKANGKRIRNVDSPVSIAKFPLKGEQREIMH